MLKPSALVAIAIFCYPEKNLRAQDAVSAPAIEVTGQAPDLLSQQSAVGPYQQPEWTTKRAFSNSRVYVLPPGTVEVVQFWTPEWKDGNIEHAFREEVEIGLPYRFQLDLYQNWGIKEGDSFYKGSSVELRYALANWGKIPLNPTLYGEWNFNNNAADVWEVKLLLGESFAKRWNWAANVTFEQETGGERERELQITSALSYAVVDGRINVGIEALWERKTAAGSRNDPEYEMLIGPSVHVRPTRNTYITAAPLFGVTKDSPDAAIFIVAGFQFGGPAGKSEDGPRAPASMFGR